MLTFHDSRFFILTNRGICLNWHSMTSKFSTNLFNTPFSLKILEVKDCFFKSTHIFFFLFVLPAEFDNMRKGKSCLFLNLKKQYFNSKVGQTKKFKNYKSIYFWSFCYNLLSGLWLSTIFQYNKTSMLHEWLPNITFFECIYFRAILNALSNGGWKFLSFWSVANPCKASELN